MKGFSIQAFWTHWCTHTLFFLTAGNTHGGLAPPRNPISTLSQILLIS